MTQPNPHLLAVVNRYGKTLSQGGGPPPGVPNWIWNIDNPYLHGLFAPVMNEVRAEGLSVLGEIPRDLVGAYFRNGPNPRHIPNNRYHWFDGDGMVHGIWFEGGRARYANRWVRTPGFVAESEAARSIWPGVLGPFDFSLPGGPLKDTSNTDLIALQGRLLALWYESGALFELDPPSLESLGPIGPRLGLPARISAHSKVDPHTGEFIFFNYGDARPYLQYGVWAPDGRVHCVDIDLPGPRRPHDIGVTPNYSVLHDFPVFFDPTLFAKTGKRVPLFHRDVPTRYGVIPRWGQPSDVLWFEFEPCYMLHIVNCWEEADAEGTVVVMVGCRTHDPSLQPDPKDGPLAAMLSGLKLQANLYEWRMNLRTGEGTERKLDSLNAEFPTINPAWRGRRNRFAWLQRIPHEIPAAFHGIAKYDLQSGEVVQQYDYGPGSFGSEAPFAAPSGGDSRELAEDSGYVLSFVTDTSDWSSRCLVLDASNIDRGPIAQVLLPQRVPAGFHAVFMPGGQSC